MAKEERKQGEVQAVCIVQVQDFRAVLGLVEMEGVYPATTSLPAAAAAVGMAAVEDQLRGAAAAVVQATLAA